MSNIFKSFKSEKPASQVLSAGKHIVKVLRTFMIDSLTNHDGSAKANIHGWSIPTPQFGVSLGSVKGAGTIMNRFNGLGYLHVEKVDPEWIDEQGLVDVNGFVCKELENGTFERIESETNTEACANIMNQFIWACSAPEGTSLKDFQTLVADNDIMLEIEVIQEEYDGKFSNKVKSFKQVTITEPKLTLA